MPAEESVQLSESEVEMKEMHIGKDKSIDEKIEPLNMFIEDDIPQIPFEKSFKRANCCSKITYSYAWKLIDAIQKNDIKMTEEMIEDMTTEQFETENWVQKFLNNLKKRESAFRENEHKTGVKGKKCNMGHFRLIHMH